MMIISILLCSHCLMSSLLVLVMSKEYEELVAKHSALVADREALFFAYTTLDNKLSVLEAEIRE